MLDIEGGVPHLYGQYSRYYWTLDANTSAVFVKLQVLLGIKEELCNDEICSSIYLLLQMHQIFFVHTTFRVTMGITWGGPMAVACTN